ncbi:MULTISPECIES: 23S rRNA pseudouridine(2604) synthase RluF [Pseudidiomarina]|uniref:Pseudouridine synthase n=3 Tax=Pseudidiomarina TaxID=2800384 RepID=A0A368UZQ4_9GAMM|nr:MULTISPECIES: 23S rRNA pseudouridine(2604) synthase RluF [Pseudidiomarina]MDX1525273.1 23S rRNA pseudouridine(2604) synthase RluF [Pseudidiomarina maritima]PWW14382.1 ribosomal large subunit pseudouridine synthase F [Pseudidiomarina maritima]RBP92618.1 ribosomal large subunit pseudouridine synthase F [Pseudidiomarina tainanensis]RCW34427.1 ribosomal large subunit pseudouridine synthase F [Pseudidiomarina tainanensis]
MQMNQSSPRDAVRLNKFISESGMCSRREADRFIEQGQVTLNGRPAVVGDKVGPSDEVRVNGRLVAAQNKDKFVFIALNKPVGIVSTTDSAEPKNIQKFVGHKERIFPIGRLDKDSQGLIFLTSNGDLVNKILRAGNRHEKEYVVTVHKPITADFIKGMANGVPILGTMTKRCKVQQLSSFVFRLTLVEGMNRQIRRMCEYFGYEVRKLERTRIMNVRLGTLQVGQWRNLNAAELADIMAAIEGSTGLAPEGHKSRRPKPQKVASASAGSRSERQASVASRKNRRGGRYD